MPLAPTEPACSIVVEDRTPEGQYYGAVNHAEFRIIGGSNDGWTSKRFALQKGRNILPIPCARVRTANRVQVWLYGNESLCRYIDITEASGVLDANDPVWMIRS